jgi:Raf kinase inhibitor-like YbhB/YbcL family protein
MRLKSADFNDYFYLPDTCIYSQGNMLPNLNIDNIPDGTTNLALVMYDSDIMYDDRELTYWIVWGLPIDIGDISNLKLPPGAVEGTNDMGTVGYYGPTLQRAIHHVHFQAFALNSDLNLDSSCRRGDFNAALNGHFLDHADLVGMIQQSDS